MFVVQFHLYCLLNTYTLKAIFTYTCKINESYNTFERNNLILDHLSRGLSLTIGYRHRLVKLAICLNLC